MKREVLLFLDSGIFSAWTRGESIDVKDYIEFVQDNKKWLHSYVSLDVIPGKFGVTRTQSEVELSAQGSYDNLQKMKEAGLSPIPVFHQGERMQWLERMLADGEPYMGISSAKDLDEAEQRRWLDDVFSLITDKQGRPLVRTHGFGVTRPSFLLRYPWHTTDSTTWSLTPSYGSILVPVWGAKGWDYTQPPIRITLSGVFNAGGSNQKKQFEGLGPTMQEYVRRYVEECGFTIQQARYGTTNRRQCVCLYYMKLAESLRGLTFKHRRSIHLPKAISKAKPLDLGVTVIFATNLNRQWAAMMTRIGARNRLLSYYELREKPPGTIKEYVTKGNIGGEYIEGTRMVAKWSSERYRNFRRLRHNERLTAYLAEDTPPWE